MVARRAFVQIERGNAGQEPALEVEGVEIEHARPLPSAVPGL
jgi:hypothetical protein